MVGVDGGTQDELVSRRRISGVADPTTPGAPTLIALYGEGSGGCEPSMSEHRQRDAGIPRLPRPDHVVVKHSLVLGPAGNAPRSAIESRRSSPDPVASSDGSARTDEGDPAFFHCAAGRGVRVRLVRDHRLRAAPRTPRPDPGDADAIQQRNQLRVVARLPGVSRNRIGRPRLSTARCILGAQPDAGPADSFAVEGEGFDLLAASTSSGHKRHAGGSGPRSSPPS